MKLKSLIGAMTIGALLLCSCGGNSQVAVQVGSSKLTVGHVKFLAEYGSSNPDAEYAAKNIQQNYLVYQLAKKMGIEMSEDEKSQVKTRLHNFKSQLGGKSEADKLLKSYGVKDDFLEVMLSTSTYAPKLLEQIEVAEPTDDEMREYFKTDYLRAKHVLISTQNQLTGESLEGDDLAAAEKTANEVLERAKNGEDFGALITEFNTDPGMNSNPDGYYFTDDEMVKEFEETTKSLQPGEFGLCKTDYGFHIIQRLPIDDPADLFETNFEKNKNSISANLSVKNEIAAFEAKAAELGIDIKLNEDIVKSIEITVPEEDTEE